MAPPTTVHLVRHATHAQLVHTLAGRLPIPLDAPGQAQAARLAPRFVPPIAALFTSPVRRAMETAAPLAEHLALVPVIEPGLAEIEFGDWTGRSFAELEADPAWRAWNRLRCLSAPPGGEPMHAAQSRALATLHRLRHAHPGETLVLVSHADIIKAILAPFLGLSLDNLYRLAVSPASVSTLTLWDEDGRIDGINRDGPPA